MADVVYNMAKFQWFAGELDLNLDDIRVLLLSANSDINPDDDTVSAVLARAGTTEHPDATAKRYTFTSEAVGDTGTSTTAPDDTNDRAEFDAEDAVFSAIPAGSDVVGCLIFKQVTDDTDSIPIAHIDSGFPVTPNGSDITIQWNAEGILALT